MTATIDNFDWHTFLRRLRPAVGLDRDRMGTFGKGFTLLFSSTTLFHECGTSPPT